MRKIYTLIMMLFVSASIFRAHAQDRAFSATNPVELTVGGMYSYKSDDVTYNIIINNGNMTVVVPEFTLPKTMIGDLFIGGYTVEGLTYDESRGGYYRDYTNDMVMMKFKSSMGIDGTYQLTGNMLVKLTEDMVSIDNEFKPGKMPLGSIRTAFSGMTTGISNVTADNKPHPRYNLAGQRVSGKTKGIVISNGKKTVF